MNLAWTQALGKQKMVKTISACLNTVSKLPTWWKDIDIDNFLLDWEGLVPQNAQKYVVGLSSFKDMIEVRRWQETNVEIVKKTRNMRQY